eukprot:scaffold22.g6149.t1
MSVAAEDLPSTSAPGLPGSEDRIVRELDVYLCSSVQLAAGTQTVLLQSPLRPHWRPYQNPGGFTDVKKLQASFPLDTRSANYNDAMDSETKQVKSMLLASSRVEPRTQFAVGFVDEHRLLLLPVDQALQLRPSLVHLDREREDRRHAAGGAGAEAEEEKPAPAELMPVTVQARGASAGAARALARERSRQMAAAPAHRHAPALLCPTAVKRRETEQQQEARLRSYAHLAAQEEADAWVPLQYHADTSELAHNIFATLEGAAAPPLPATLSRAQYLDAIVPGTAALHDQQPQEIAFGAAATGGGELGRPKQEADLLPEGVAAKVPGAVAALLAQAAVAQLDVIRTFLCRYKPEPEVSAAAATCSDAALHHAVLGGGAVLCIRRSYLLAKTGQSAIDPLRGLVIELLQEKEHFKRAELLEAATAKGIPVSDSLYSKVVKDLCSSRGSIWSLK